MGLSPLETLRQTLLEEQSATTYRRAYWNNAARLEGVVQRPATAPKWTTQQKQAWREQWAQRFAGAGNAGQVAVLEDGMTFTPTSWNAQQSEYIAARKLTREDLILSWMMDNAVLRHGRNKEVRLDKEASKEKIDGPVALVIANARRIAQPQPVPADDPDLVTA